MELKKLNLDKLRIFYHAAMAKSFTNCGLHLSPSAISRHVADLEYWLKVKLFVRHPKGMSLTPEGEKLLETCHTVFKELEGVKDLISIDTEKPEGLIKVTTPPGWMGTMIIRLLKNFLEDNPAVRLNIKSFDGIPDFTRSEADIALLPFVPQDPELIGEKLMTLHLGLYASKEYLQKHGTPETVEDLKDHQLISYGEHEHAMINANWHLNLGLPEGQSHEPYLTVNNPYYAAEAGYGIVTLMQENLLLRDNRLVQILPGLTGPTVGAYCIYPKRLQKSKRIQAFLHYLKQEIHEQKWL